MLTLPPLQPTDDAAAEGDRVVMLAAVTDNHVPMVKAVSEHLAPLTLALAHVATKLRKAARKHRRSPRDQQQGTYVVLHIPSPKPTKRHDTHRKASFDIRREGRPPLTSVSPPPPGALGT